MLALDVGTQSVRALVFDGDGNLLARSRVPLVDYRSSRPDWHEHDANGFWEALCSACARLWQAHPELRERVLGVGLTTQRGTVVNVDDRGEPLRPAITWLDQRKALVVPRISALWRAAFALARVSETIRYLQQEAEANWLRSEEPQVWSATYKYLLLSGFLIQKLTGKFVDSTASQVGYVPFDYRRLRWASRHDWKWQALRIDPQLLPELAAPGTALGGLTDAAADATSIRRGTPVIAAAADKACEVLGAGCLDSNVGCLSYGTAATMNVCSTRYVEVTPFIPPYPAAVPNAYNIEVQISRGFWMVEWFKAQFGLLERLAAKESGGPVEALFDELVESVPPGSAGLLVQPYWSPGLRRPGPEARGAMIGFGAVHTRAHVYRAILEGLAYALREGKERIELRGHFRVGDLRVAGGGSQSDAAMQVTADIFGMPCSRPHVYEASGLGVAIDVAVGLGIHPDFSAATRAMTRIAQTFEPRPQHVELYQAVYERIYKRVYPQLQGLYHAMREIYREPEAPPLCAGGDVATTPKS